MRRQIELPVQWRISPSRRLRQLVLCLHLLALFACWSSAIPVAIKILLTLVMIITAYRCYREPAAPVYRLRYSQTFGWELAEDGAAFDLITLLPSTVVSQYLTVIHFATETQRRQSLVVVKDSLTQEQYRQLIVKLRVVGSRD